MILSNPADWRHLNDDELSIVIPWMRIQCRYKASIPLFFLVFQSILILLLLILFLIDGDKSLLQKDLWLVLPAGIMIFISYLCVNKEIRKMRKIVEGHITAADVTVTKKDLGHTSRHSYYRVTVHSRTAVESFNVSWWIYRKVSVGDRAWIIKYSVKEGEKMIKDIDFVPRREYKSTN